ncbi:hypothetical protein ANI_1_1300104 [Paecilomyces variotii No. 5]|uniref:Clr5 domain-containing protein n=1 Tax=Byssochlamys spectabilis (strain No. 5 / NBRC 109023) TaxID=1356009 RepID=V5G5A1_BYSSN|nr:hypothetical protein ANI_1_1300104 [Paecilomyces variotii No. 5]
MSRAMKNNIPSEIWEKKKPLIIKYYTVEEWPLKQVIKKIRTPDFDPRTDHESFPASETQLRSRLKKWRITKPSRQTRKKPQEKKQEVTREENDSHVSQPEIVSPADTKPAMVPAVHPSATPVQTQQPAVLISSQQDGSQNQVSTNTEWYDPKDWYIKQEQTTLQSPAPFNGPNISNHWVSPEPQQPSAIQQDGSNQYHSTPVMQHQYSTVPAAVTLPYEQIQPVTAASNTVTVAAMPMMAPAYNSHTYTVPQTCGPPEVAINTPAQWPNGSQNIELDQSYVGSSYPGMDELTAWTANAIPQYYNMPTPVSSMMRYPSQMQSMPTHNSGQIIAPQQHFSPSSSLTSLGEFGAGKTWRRASEIVMNGHARVDRQGRQRRPVADRRRQKPMDMMDPGVMAMPARPPFMVHEQQPMMPANMYSYPGQEPFVHKPPGCG